MTRGRLTAALVAAALLAAGCSGEEPPPTPSRNEDLSVTSSAFQDGGTIPVTHTCDGENLPPPLVWAGEPEGTAAFAVIVSDPDAPGGDFIHMVAFDIPATEHALDLAAGFAGEITFGVNSFDRPDYDGPCPPEGADPHRYRFTVYALSRVLGLEADVSYEDVRAEIDQAALASGTLEGLFGH